ncbi:MAG: ABC transporter substrate-binding protein [Chloroflexi bacterium]|nr:ABC transporter substrate-binding protein [Chloroflexota bacterium]
MGVFIAAALLFASCGGGGNGGEEQPTPDGPVTIKVWHSMPSLAEGVIKRMAMEFNESQSQYQVELIFQGSYSDSLNKLIASTAENVPNVIQLSDASTQIMIDSAPITPVQEFIDAEGFDLSDFEPKAISYYTVGDTLYSMPFNLAGPILYYDRGAFEDAGLDPDQPPKTLDEVRAYSEQIVQSAAEGEERTGIALVVSAWYFEQMLAKDGALYVDGENGRDGRATEAMFSAEAGTEIIEWWGGMVADGLAYNAGGDTLDAMFKLASGETAMVIASTAALRGAIAAMTIAGLDVNQYDAAAMPGQDGAGGGIVLGGASFWILSDPPSFEQQGAWEFLKFASSTEQQARWHVDTGYFPSRVSSLSEPIVVEAWKQFPQFEVALQQLHDSPDTAATRGVLLGPLNEIREEVVKAFERVLAGGADPAEALQDAAEEANEIMDDYNRTAP